MASPGPAEALRDGGGFASTTVISLDVGNLLVRVAELEVRATLAPSQALEVRWPFVAR
jgi:hypothetical protein